MKYIGIDNGLKGGIIVLDEKQKVIASHVMPVIGTTKKEYDIQAITKILLSHNTDVICMLEKAQPQFRDGGKQAFKTGYGYGVMQGLLTALNIPFQIIPPKKWQKIVFDGLNQTDTKLASALFCKRKWPLVGWKATQRCTTDHDGLTDAACIAYFGCLLNG